MTESKQVPSEPVAVTKEMIDAALPWLANIQHMQVADKRNAVQEAIRAALASAPSEPATTQETGEQLTAVFEGLGMPDMEWAIAQRPSVLKVICAAIADQAKEARTAPPSGAGETLTDEEIQHLWDTHVGDWRLRYPFGQADSRNFARAIIANLDAKRAGGQHD